MCFLNGGGGGDILFVLQVFHENRRCTRPCCRLPVLDCRLQLFCEEDSIVRTTLSWHKIRSFRIFFSIFIGYKLHYDYLLDAGGVLGK